MHLLRHDLIDPTAANNAQFLNMMQTSIYLLPFAVCEKRLLHVETVEFGWILRQHFVKLLDKTGV
jgi:hypothetical protein